MKTFANPTPALSVLTGLLNTLTTCQTAALTKGRGTASARDAQWLLVVSAFDQELAYVQVLADAAGGPDQAIAIFQLAGMTYEKAHVQPKRTYRSFQEKSTVVQFTTPTAGSNTATIWEYGLSPTAMTSWIVTIHGELTLENQTPGTTIYLRYRVVTTKGYEAWSQTIQHLVT